MRELSSYTAYGGSFIPDAFREDLGKVFVSAPDPPLPG
jgi:hypothetical protein